MNNRDVFVGQLHAHLRDDLGPENSDWGAFPDASLAFCTWVRTGTLFYHSPESSHLSVRVPLVSALSVDSRICKWIDDRNYHQYAGHYWLREGSDDQHWSLMCGLKYPWDWMDQHQAEVILQTTPSLGAVLGDAVVDDFIRDFGGSRAWDPTADSDGMGAAALVFMS